jgi:hypothetical protein
MQPEGRSNAGSILGRCRLHAAGTLVLTSSAAEEAKAGRTEQTTARTVGYWHAWDLCVAWISNN